MSDPWVTALQTASRPASESRAANSPTTASIVSDMLVPVSPSGTGKTLSLLTSSIRSLRAAAAAATREPPGDVFVMGSPWLLADFDALNMDIDRVDLYVGYGGQYVSDAITQIV